MNSSIISIDNWQQNGNFSIIQNSCQLLSFTLPAYTWVPQVNFSIIGTPYTIAYYAFDGFDGPVVCQTTDKTLTLANTYSANVTSPISLDDWNKITSQETFEIPTQCYTTGTIVYLHIETTPDTSSATILQNSSSSSALPLHFSVTGLGFNATNANHSGYCATPLTMATNSTNSSLTNSTSTTQVPSSAISEYSSLSLIILALAAFIAIVPLVV